MPLNIFDEYVSFFLKLCVSFFRSVTFRFPDYNRYDYCVCLL